MSWGCGGRAGCAMSSIDPTGSKTTAKPADGNPQAFDGRTAPSRNKPKRTHRRRSEMFNNLPECSGMFSARPIAGCETKPTAHSGARTLLLQCFLLIAREHED